MSINIFVFQEDIIIIQTHYGIYFKVGLLIDITYNFIQYYFTSVPDLEVKVMDLNFHVKVFRDLFLLNAWVDNGIDVRLWLWSKALFILSLTYMSDLEVR